MNTFQTRDIRLAAAIMSCTNAQLISFDRADAARITFGFFRDDVTDEFIESYQNHDLRVEPLRYAMAKRYLERIAYEGFHL